MRRRKIDVKRTNSCHSKLLAVLSSVNEILTITILHLWNNSSDGWQWIRL